MKYVYSLLLSGIIATGIFAQAPSNTLKAGVQISRTPYENCEVWGPHLQYDRVLNRRFTLSAAASYSQCQPYYSGGERASIGDSVIYENYYRYYHKEQFAYLEINGSYSFTGNDSRYNLKFGTGLTAALDVFYYPLELIIDRGVITRISYTEHRPVVLMANVVLENEYKLSSRFTLSARGAVRHCFGEQSVVTREVKYPNGGKSTSTGGILYNLSFGLGLGYSF